MDPSTSTTHLTERKDPANTTDPRVKSVSPDSGLASEFALRSHSPASMTSDSARSAVSLIEAEVIKVPALKPKPTDTWLHLDSAIKEALPRIQNEVLPAEKLLAEAKQLLKQSQEFESTLPGEPEGPKIKARLQVQNSEILVKRLTIINAATVKTSELGDKSLDRHTLMELDPHSVLFSSAQTQSEKSAAAANRIRTIIAGAGARLFSGLNPSETQRVNMLLDSMTKLDSFISPDFPDLIYNLITRVTCIVRTRIADLIEDVTFYKQYRDMHALNKQLTDRINTASVTATNLHSTLSRIKSKDQLTPDVIRSSLKTVKKSAKIIAQALKGIDIERSQAEADDAVSIASGHTV